MTENFHNDRTKSPNNLPQIRESRGLSLRDLSTSTRISYTVLEAIEKEDYARLPEPIYARSFIRTYANELEIDSEQILSSYETYLKEQQQVTTEDAAANEKPWITEHYSLITWITVIVITVGLAFFFFRHDILFHNTAPPVHTAQVQQPTPEPAVTEAPEAVTEKPVLPTPPEDESDMPAEPDSGQQAESIVMPGDNAREDMTDASPAGNEQTATPGETALPSSPSPDAQAYEVVITAEETTWIRIEEESREPAEILMQPGERFEDTFSGKTLFVIGNAGGIDIAYNGKSLGSLGRHGQVVNLTFPADSGTE